MRVLRSVLQCDHTIASSNISLWWNFDSIVSWTFDERPLCTSQILQSGSRETTLSEFSGVKAPNEEDGAKLDQIEFSSVQTLSEEDGAKLDEIDLTLCNLWCFFATCGKLFLLGCLLATRWHVETFTTRFFLETLDTLFLEIFKHPPVKKPSCRLVLAPPCWPCTCRGLGTRRRRLLAIFDPQTARVPLCPGIKL